MKNITSRFTTQYHPRKSLVMYQAAGSSSECFVEAYDISPEGKMINPHPLSIKESIELGTMLTSSLEKDNHVFEPEGLLPTNVLYASSKGEGTAVWFTPAGNHHLLFREDLGIASGAYPLPALLWKADKEKLHIYALKLSRRPNTKTKIYKAPFFNIHDSGLVCMGTVNIDISKDCKLEQFIEQWQSYFFNSYFSHLLGEVSPVKGNIVQLYQTLAETAQPFPVEELLPISKNIQTIIHEK